MPKSVRIAFPSGLISTLLGLTSPVQDPGGVRGAKRVEQREAELGGLRGRQRTVLCDDLIQRPGLDELHHDPRHAVLFDHVEDGDDAGMVKPGGRSGLAERALVAEPLLGLRRHRRQRDLLDGHVAVD
jgi:hypothetical protein